MAWLQELVALQQALMQLLETGLGNERVELISLRCDLRLLAARCGQDASGCIRFLDISLLCLGYRVLSFVLTRLPITGEVQCSL